MSHRRAFREVGEFVLANLELTSPAASSSPEPHVHWRADLTMVLDHAPAAESGDPRRTFVEAHLRARLRAVAAARPREVPEALARDLAAVLLSEDRVHSVQVVLSRPAIPAEAGGGEWRLVYRRDQTRADPPFASRKLLARTHRMQFAGTLLKGWARLFHAVFPRRRWTLPPSDSARTPVGPESEFPIPRIIWQTNFTADCSLPLWFNYCRNRRLSPTFEHRFVDTEGREAYLRAHAPERILRAYLRIEDGAAQADLWRLFVLWREGGVYMDFDASLVQPLERILAGRTQILLWNRKRFTNYFMATVPGNPLFAAFLETVVSNIERHPGGAAPDIFHTTGPAALEPIVDALPVPDYVPHRSCCIQGAFSDEHFQYIDRPGTKWTRKREFLRPLPKE